MPCYNYNCYCWLLILELVDLYIARLMELSKVPPSAPASAARTAMGVVWPMGIMHVVLPPYLNRQHSRMCECVVDLSKDTVIRTEVIMSWFR